MILSVALTRNGKVALTGSRDGTARLWDLVDPSDPKLISIIPGHLDVISGHMNKIFSVALTPDGKMALIGYEDGTVWLWDLSDPASPKQSGILSGHTDLIWSISFTSDGKIALTGSEDRTARLWDLSDPASPRQLGVLSGHTAAIWSDIFDTRWQGGLNWLGGWDCASLGPE